MELELSKLETENYFLYPNYPWVLSRGSISCSVSIMAYLFCVTLVCFKKQGEASIGLLSQISL